MTPYTRHQLVVLLVLLLVAGLGLAVGHWRRAHPELIERLERLDRRVAPGPSDAPAAPGEVTAPRPGSPDLRSDAPGRGRAARPRARAAGKPDAAPVDPNRAGLEELVRLPGVGPALAARIVAVREAAGPFATPDDLRRVRGVGRATLERLRPWLRIAG